MARFITPNEIEAAGLLGVREIGDPGEVIDALRSQGWTGIVLTLGARGVQGVDVDGAPFAVPAPEVTVVDTTGAGDAFTGAFAAGLAAGMATEAAAQLGVAYATQSVQAHGTQTAFPRAIPELVR